MTWIGMRLCVYRCPYSAAKIFRVFFSLLVVWLCVCMDCGCSLKLNAINRLHYHFETLCSDRGVVLRNKVM